EPPGGQPGDVAGGAQESGVAEGEEAAEAEQEVDRDREEAPQDDVERQAGVEHPRQGERDDEDEAVAERARERPVHGAICTSQRGGRYRGRAGVGVPPMAATPPPRSRRARRAAPAARPPSRRRRGRSRTAGSRRSG